MCQRALCYFHEVMVGYVKMRKLRLHCSDAVMKEPCLHFAMIVRKCHSLGLIVVKTFAFMI